MASLRFSTNAAFLLFLVSSLLVSVPAVAQDEAQALDRAAQLFDQGDYLAAQELLIGIDRAKLTAKQQTRRDDYLNRVQVAITMYEKALRDLEDAETAIAEGESERAEHLLNAVLANEYAAEAVRRSATAQLTDLKNRPAPGDTAETEGAPARAAEQTQRETAVENQPTSS